MKCVVCRVTMEKASTTEGSVWNCPRCGRFVESTDEDEFLFRPFTPESLKIQPEVLRAEDSKAGNKE